LWRIYTLMTARCATPEDGVMQEDNYWQRLAARRLSRRRLLVGAAGVGAGLAASSLPGCGGGDKGTGTSTPDASPRSTGEPSETATPVATPMALEPAKTRG